MIKDYKLFVQSSSTLRSDALYNEFLATLTIQNTIISDQSDIKKKIISDIYKDV